jgi:hypothetical protein
MIKLKLTTKAKKTYKNGKGNLIVEKEKMKCFYLYIYML